MGVLVRLKGEVKWTKESTQSISSAATDAPGAAKNHSARKHKYKEWLGLPNTVGNVVGAYRLPEALASADGPPTCVSVEDAADYDVEEGKSASAGRGWEGRVMRWAVLQRCIKPEYGSVDITLTVPRYNESGALKLGQLPRDGSLLLLLYNVPRNIDPYAQLKGFKRFTTHASESAEAKWERAQSATKFIVFSRARSASTTFITALNAHPNISCGYEIFSPHNFAADGLREALGFDTHAEVMGRMPDFMASFWSLCPSLACGFKVFPGQIRPASALKQIFDGVSPASRHTLRAILLERSNITAEWLSVRKASSTGNWGTSPQRQKTIASSTKLSERLKLAVQQQMNASSAAPPATTAPTAGASTASTGGAAGPSLAQFTREHKAWFSSVTRIVQNAPPAAAENDGAAAAAAAAPPALPPIPLLRVYTEDLIEGGKAFEDAMRGAYRFLGLPNLDGPLTLPARVTAPEKAQVGKRVSKSRSYKQRREAELKRRAGMQQQAAAAGGGGGA